MRTRAQQPRSPSRSGSGSPRRRSGAGEIHDIANDPTEMDNRFGGPACAAVQRRLADMIRSRPDDARDPPLAAGGMA